MGSDESAKHLQWLQKYHCSAFGCIVFFILNIYLQAASCKKTIKSRDVFEDTLQGVQNIQNVSRDLPDNSQRDWHGTVYDNVNVFGLGGIDAAAAEQVPRLAIANTSTTCCCEHVRTTAAAQNNI